MEMRGRTWRIWRRTCKYFSRNTTFPPLHCSYVLRRTATSAIVPWIFYWPTSGRLNLLSAWKYFTVLTLFTTDRSVSPLDYSRNYRSYEPKSSFKSMRMFPPSQWSFNQSLLWSTITCVWCPQSVWLASGQKLHERCDCCFPPAGASTTRAPQFNNGAGVLCLHHDVAAVPLMFPQVSVCLQWSQL